MSTWELIPCPVVARYPTRGHAYGGWRLRAGWAVGQEEGRRAYLFDDRLSLVRTVDLGALGWDVHSADFAVSPDSELVAVTNSRGVRVADLDGRLLWERDYSSAWTYRYDRGGVHLAADGQLWYAQPVRRGFDEHVLQIVDARSGELFATGDIENDCGHAYGFLPIPNSASMLVTIANGQDPADTILVRPQPGACAVSFLPRGDRTPTLPQSISPDGSECVASPHECDELSVLAVRTGEILASVSETEVFRGNPTPQYDNTFEYAAVYVTGDVIVTATTEGNMIVIDRGTMTVRGILAPQGIEPVERDGVVYTLDIGLELLGVGPNNRLLVSHGAVYGLMMIDVSELTRR